jgi:hypothetical protein
MVVPVIPALRQRGSPSQGQLGLHNEALSQKTNKQTKKSLFCFSPMSLCMDLFFFILLGISCPFFLSVAENSSHYFVEIFLISSVWNSNLMCAHPAYFSVLFTTRSYFLLLHLTY